MHRIYDLYVPRGFADECALAPARCRGRTAASCRVLADLDRGRDSQKQLLCGKSRLSEDHQHRKASTLEPHGSAPSRVRFGAGPGERPVPARNGSNCPFPPSSTRRPSRERSNGGRITGASLRARRPRRHSYKGFAFVRIVATAWGDIPGPAVVADVSITTDATEPNIGVTRRAPSVTILRSVPK